MFWNLSRLILMWAGLICITSFWKKNINFYIYIYIYTINIQHTAWCHFILLKTVEAMSCWLCGSCASRFTAGSQHQRGTLHCLVCSHLHWHGPACRDKQWTGAGDTHLHPGGGPLKVTDTLTSCHAFQFDWCAWVPNTPCTMRQPPPEDKDATMELIMATLPDVSQSCVQMAITWHLGRAQPDAVRTQHNTPLVQMVRGHTKIWFTRMGIVPWGRWLRNSL